MSRPSLDFKAVDDVATTEAARELIGEYLRWIAHLAKGAFGAVLLGVGIFLVHRQIERRIDEIGRL